MVNYNRATPRLLIAGIFAALATGCNNDGPAGPGGGPTHPAGVIEATRNVGDRPYAVAVTPSGRAMVTLLDRQLLISDVLPDTSFDQAITVGHTPTDIALNQAGDMGFIANQYDDNIQVFDPASGATSKLLPVTGDPFAVLPNEVGSTIFVTTNANRLYKISVADGSVAGQIATDGSAAQALAVNPKTGLLYVSTRAAGTVMEVDPATMTVLRDFNLGGTTQELAVTPDGSELWVANEGGYVAVVTLSTGASTILATGGQSWGLAMSPDHAQVWVGLLDRGIVKVFDRVTKASLQSILVGGIPRRIRFSPDGKQAVIANESGYISIVR